MSETTTTTTRWDELTEAGRQAVARGDLAAATASYRSALAEAEATAPDSTRVASSLGSLAQVRYQARDYAEAEPLFRRAMGLRERLLGAEHPNVAQTLNNLAAVHVALGSLDEAEPLLLRSLAITERHRGRSHPDVAVNLNNLAKLYFKRNEHAKAEPLLVRLLELEKAANPTNPKVATALTSLASSRLAQGDLAGVEAYLRRAEEIVGAQNPSVGAVRAKLDALRSGRATPNATAGAIDPSMLISGPVSSSSDGPARRPSGSLPMNPWLAESEPPSVIAAESGDFEVTQPPAAESTRIVPTGTQEPIAPPLRTSTPAPLPPLVVPAQVPREFADAMGRAPSEGSAAPGASQPPIKEAPSARPTAASLEAAVAALSRFAPPPAEPRTAPVLPPQASPLPQAPQLPQAPHLLQVSPPAPLTFASAVGSPAPAPIPTLAPIPTIAPIAPPIAEPVAHAPLAPPPLIPPPAAPLPRPPAVGTAAAFVPAAAYAPSAAPSAAPPAAASAFAAPDRRPARSSEGPRFGPPAAAASSAPVREARSARGPATAERRHSPRKPRLQHDDARSSGGGVFKFVLVAFVAAALGGGAWIAFARTEGRRSSGTSEGGSTSGGAPAGQRSAPGAPSPITGVPSGAPPGAVGQPPIDDITSSPVPMSRRDSPRPAPTSPIATPRPTLPAALPGVNTEQITRGIDSVAKKVDATLRPTVAAPAFGKPASP